jgi:lactate dehydrogenase-like 2-hydroxyacid dehydrogenase
MADQISARTRRDIDIVVSEAMQPQTMTTLQAQFRVHVSGPGHPPIGEETAARVRGYARRDTPLPASVLQQFPRLEIIGNFGVGYDGIDLDYVGRNGIIVTNTPDVLTEEVADTALGLLLATVREFPQAERHLRNGLWETEGPYPLTRGSLRDRTVGILGLGRIGMAIARRLEAARIPVVYHSRRPRPDAPYRHYDDLIAMADAVDTLIAVLPGGAATDDAIDAQVLKALGPRGVLINMGRGNSVDEEALAEALRNGTIHAAGLDVFKAEPRVSQALLDLPNTVLFPHMGSGTVFTREAMGQLVVDNLIGWFDEGAPLTPVPESGAPRQAR